MLDVADVGAEEDEVAGLQRLARRDGRTGVVLLLRGARQLDARGLVGGLDEAGAVEAAGPVAAPAGRGCRSGPARSDRDGGGRRLHRAAADAGPSGSLNCRSRPSARTSWTYAVGVVVGVDGAGAMGRRGRCWREQSRRRRRSRRRVVEAGRVHAAGRDPAVLGEGGGHELHRPFRAGSCSRLRSTGGVAGRGRTRPCRSRRAPPRGGRGRWPRPAGRG